VASIRVGLGLIGGRTFVNNVSFGAYAEVVQTPRLSFCRLRPCPLAVVKPDMPRVRGDAGCDQVGPADPPKLR